MRLKLVLLFIFSVILLSYKLAVIPAGLTIDEASFGYNAVLLSRTLRDENKRLLPVFVLSIDKNDWRQPITQYYMTGFFKLVKPSIYNLRFTSVLIGALSVGIMFVSGGFIPALLLLTTPIFFMHSHLALDNIMPIPFVLIWLFNIYKYSKEKNIKNLIIAGLTIGLGFYSYKGIRVFIPIWLLTSSLFIYLTSKNIKHVIYYVLSVLPFFAIIPYLELKYAGAVLNNETIKFEGIYTFVFRYLSAFDFSFLYIKGDEMLIHSTGQHGMFLLATLPLFLVGVINSWKKDLYYKFIILSFLLGPLLFGFFGSIHRASRMLSEIPFYIVICTFGANWIYNKNKKIYFVLVSLVVINFLSYLNYYWYTYPEATSNLFFSMNAGEEYKNLKEISDKYNVTPYVDAAKVSKGFSSGDFVRSIYFTEKPMTWDGKIENLPQKSVLMTDNQNIKGLTKLDYKYMNFVYYLR